VRAKEETAEGADVGAAEDQRRGESSFETGRDGKLRRKTRAGQRVGRVLMLSEDDMHATAPPSNPSGSPSSLLRLLDIL
jgi:hypothetical protein